MRLNRSSQLLILLSSIFPMSSFAAETTSIGTISVQGQSLGGGQMIEEDSGKTRSTITKEAMDKMSGASNAIDKLKYTPGVNVHSNDSSGLSGLDFTMRGMTADQIGVSIDGIPINDSGNYNVYPNLLGDSDNIEEVFVTQGSSEADGPHIGSSGGNIGLVTVRPTKDFGIFVRQNIGSNNLTKSFFRLNTGEFNGFRSWISYSHTEADKWKGKGRNRADKFEGNLLYETDSGDSSNLVIKYHNQDNTQYDTLSKKEYSEHGRKWEPSKHKDGNRYYKYAKNPFENLNVTFTQKLKLLENLSLTVQPYYYWGNGGGTGPFSNNIDPKKAKSEVYDLSKVNSKESYYRSSWTQTWRPAITTKLQWDINDQHSLDFGYWYERARQRQTQPFIPLKDSGNPKELWADNHSKAIRDANGNVIHGRNQITTTPAQKLWIQDTWYTTPDLTIQAGLAYERAKREGNNKGSLNAKPEKKSAHYHKFLPTLNVSYKFDQDNQTYYNLTRNMRIPQNYVLYNTGDSLSLKPELSWNHELGYRYASKDMLFSASLFYLTYSNRQISTQNEDFSYEMINAGQVKNKGVQIEWGGNLPYHFNYYTSFTHTKAEQKKDLLYRGKIMPTKGKQLANVPKNTLNVSLGYDDSQYYAKLSGRYESYFYGDLSNKERIGGHTLLDFTSGVKLPTDKKYIKDATLRFGINNLLDKKYLSSARTIPVNSQNYQGVKGNSPRYNVGEERTFNVSFEANF